MEQALHNVERVLKAAGLTKDQVVQCRIYIADVSYWDAINEVYRRFFGEHTTAGNYAAYLKYCQMHGKTPDSLLTMCGAGLKSDH